MASDAFNVIVDILVSNVILVDDLLVASSWLQPVQSECIIDYVDGFGGTHILN